MAGTGYLKGSKSISGSVTVPGVATEATLATLALENGGNLDDIAARLLSGGDSAAAILASILSAAGATTGAAVTSDVDGTLQQYLRGLVALFSGRIPTIGQKAAAGSVSVIEASDSTLAKESGGNLDDIAARLLNGGSSAADLLALVQAALVDGDTVAVIANAILTALGDLGLDKTPIVANAPTSPGQVLDYPGSTAASQEVTVAALTPGVRYQLEVIPADLSDVPAAPTDFIRGVFKCDANTGASQIADMDGGRVITSYRPEQILLPAGSTKVRVHFLRDSATAFDCQVYLSEVQS